MRREQEFVCKNCNYTSEKWGGQCPSCHEYNTFTEHEKAANNLQEYQGANLKSATSLPVNLGDYERRELSTSTTSGIETLLEAEQGYIVGRIGNEWLKYHTDAHLLTIAPTGEGKGTGLIIPNLFAHEGSTVVIDIRGETVAKTANYRRLQGHKVIVLDPFDITKKQYGHDSYNPFDRIVQNLDNRSSDDQIQRLVSALMFDPSGRMSNEPIWDNATKNLLSGLISLCVRYWRPHRHSLVEILDVLNYSEPEMERFLIELKGIIEHDPQGKKDRQIKGLYKVLTESKSTTKITDNALVQAQTILTWVGNKSFEGIVDRSTFTFDDLQREKMTVYLVVPEEYIDSCAVWVRLMLESAVFSLEDIYSSKGISTSQLPQRDRVLFLLDELPAFGQLDIISSGMATLRGRGVNLWLFIQNLAQLESTYGKEKMRTIIGNAAAIQVFGSTELEELEYFTRLIGEEFFDVQSVGISESETEGTNSSNTLSHTVSNSESITKTKGTADTFSEATGTTWNKSLGRTTNRSRTYTKNESTSAGSSYGTNRGSNEGYNKGTNRGTNKGKSQGTSSGRSYKRNLLWSTTDESNNDGANQGTSSGSSKGSSSGYSGGTSKGSNTSRSNTDQTGSSEGFTKGKSRTTTTSKGGSQTFTKGHTVNESTAESSQRGETRGESQTKGTSASYTRGRNISVKQERLKIETVRTLREKLSGRNQLIQIRGYHPFFVPRMKYYSKYRDTGRYMFPDMAAMSEEGTFNIIESRPELITPFTVHQEPIQEKLEVLTGLLSYTVGASSWSVIQNYQRLFSGEIAKEISSLIAQIENKLIEQSLLYSEVYILTRGFVNLLKRVDFDPYFETADTSLEDNMEKLERLNASRSSIDLSLIAKYQNLPILEIKQSLLEEENKWLVDTYAQAARSIIEILDTQIRYFLLKVKQYEEVRLWYINTLAYTKDKVEDALFVIGERESIWKHDFFMKQNNFLE